MSKEAETMERLESAFLDAFFYSRLGGKWMKSCRPKKGKRAKSGKWWVRDSVAVYRDKHMWPFRPYRNQDMGFNGIAPRFSTGGGAC